ncbi:hypothetical protein H9N25_10695 [Pedobacter riviphilus]|uniref:DUF3108 domain-containing protein n=1 Tax=Pedobacter riviphilus TaxID=2766984 RepID=A0ABX6TN01_9SPHI|nr:DUF6134 family protein [Pedobacter riviphilus]QNR86813.1 hypothetical protein H9N25_10695 [Pedobacter riviphilus]
MNNIKMKTMQFFVFFCICWVSVKTAYAQEFKYEILKGGKSIGNMQISQKRVGKNLELAMKFNAEIDLLFKNMLIEGYENASFYGGKLQRSSILRKVNGRIKADIQTQWTGKEYINTRSGKSNILPLKPIEMHLLSLYFHEPKDGSLVYSDGFAQLLKIQKDGQTYELKLPNGKENIYTYKNGICTKIMIKSAYYAVRLRKIP